MSGGVQPFVRGETIPLESDSPERPRTCALACGWAPLTPEVITHQVLKHTQEARKEYEHIKEGVKQNPGPTK